MSRLIDCDSEETTNFIECPGCEGSGGYDIGDCEDGVWETCSVCLGTGDIEEGDSFDPKHDAFRSGD